MDINSFVDMMIKRNKWIEGGTKRQNEERYRASDFSTEEFICEWDIKGIIHMLEVCSDYPRFALLTLRKRIDEISGSDELAVADTPVALGPRISSFCAHFSCFRIFSDVCCWNVYNPNTFAPKKYLVCLSPVCVTWTHFASSLLQQQMLLVLLVLLVLLERLLLVET